MFYPGPDGLLGSMRMIAFRDGLLDHTLLSMLAEKDPESAERIATGIARDIIDYTRNASDFRKARREILELLDAD